MADGPEILNYSDQETPESAAREHFRIAQKWSRPVRRPATAFSQSRDPDRPLRVGYVSRDFYTHPVGKLIQPLLAAHDRAHIELYGYYDGLNQDEWTAGARTACTSFLKTSDLSDSDLESQILKDRIDLLVDLGGHTGGGNRLHVFAAGAAPVQISFLGYPNTTGLTSIDYRLTDTYCDPPGRTEHLHSERLIRLQRGFLCYSPPRNLPPLSPAPFRDAGRITFGSFNNIAKISETALRTWACILRGVPDSRLFFKYGDRYESDTVAERILGLFAAAGVEPWRLEFLPSQPT